MVSGDSVERGHLHDFRYQHMPETSAWSSVAIQITDINTALCCRHQHAPPLWQQGPRTLSWLQTAAQTTGICLTFSGNVAMDIHRPPDSSRTVGPQNGLRQWPRPCTSA